MTSTIDTLGKAARHNMIVRVQCPTCGKTEDYRAMDLVMRFGGGRDPQSLKFYCKRCRPKMTITLLEKSGQTIGDIIREQASLRVCCQRSNCLHKVDLDLEKLAELLGHDHGAMHNDLVRLFRCRKCGGKDIGFNYTPNYKLIDEARMNR